MTNSCPRPLGSETQRHGRKAQLGSPKNTADAAKIANGFKRWAIAGWHRNLPSDWQPALADFPEHLEAIGLSTCSVVKILPLTLRFISLLSKPPAAVTREDLAAAMLKQPSRAGSLSYLALCMIARSHWPREYLRQGAEVGAIERYLSPGWRSLLSQLDKDLEDLNVPFNTRQTFRRCSALFAWWSGLPDSGTIDESALRSQWQEYWRDRPEAAGSVFPKLEWNPERCYSAIWNSLLKSGRVQGELRPFVSAAPPFWKTVAEPIRAAAHRFLGSGERAGDSAIRRRRLLYALTRLGFCAHGARRSIEIGQEEWAHLAETLRGEKFQEESIQMAISDVRSTLSYVGESGSKNG